jgi:tetratricopeptide (TPR) repeat protein
MFKYVATLLLGILLLAGATAQPGVAFYKNGLAFEYKGQYNQAIGLYKKAIGLNKNFDSAYFHLGYCYSKINRDDSAIMTLTNAVTLKPNFTQAYILMGNIYRDGTKNYDGAIGNYLMALQYDSTNKETYYSLAWCNNAKGNFRQAISYAVKALDIDNNYRIAYNELGFAYRQLKAYDECIAQFKKNLAISVNEIPLLYSGFCYIELKDKTHALEMYEQLKKLNAAMAESLKKKIDILP